MDRCGSKDGHHKAIICLKEIGVGAKKLLINVGSIGSTET